MYVIGTQRNVKISWFIIQTTNEQVDGYYELVVVSFNLANAENNHIKCVNTSTLQSHTCWLCKGGAIVAKRTDLLLQDVP